MGVKNRYATLGNIVGRKGLTINEDSIRQVRRDGSSNGGNKQTVSQSTATVQVLG